MLNATEWMANQIATAIQTKLNRGGQILIFSIDRYHFIGEICPPVRAKFMLDNNSFLWFEV